MYFMDDRLINNVWSRLGKFDNIPNMYKRLAREGQSLTQSKVGQRVRWRLTSFSEILDGDNEGDVEHDSGLPRRTEQGGRAVLFQRRLRDDQSRVDGGHFKGTQDGHCPLCHPGLFSSCSLMSSVVVPLPGL